MALTLDIFGNVYVAGRSTGPNNLADIVTVKYNPSGILQWAPRFDAGTNSVDIPAEIAIDRYGNVIVVGESHRNYVSTDGEPRLTCKGDFTTLKYSPFGVMRPGWPQHYNGTANCADYLPSVAIDRLIGNIYVTGISQGPGSGTDWATLKYGPTGGAPVWTVRHTSSGAGIVNPNDSPSDIALDFFGDVYITGTSAGNGTDLDYTTIKYNAGSVKQWERRFNVPIAGREAANALVVNRARDVFVTGWSYVPASDLDVVALSAVVHATTSRPDLRKAVPSSLITAGSSSTRSTFRAS